MGPRLDDLISPFRAHMELECANLSPGPPKPIETVRPGVSAAGRLPAAVAGRAPEAAGRVPVDGVSTVQKVRPPPRPRPLPTPSAAAANLDRRRRLRRGGDRRGTRNAA